MRKALFRGPTTLVTAISVLLVVFFLPANAFTTRLSLSKRRLPVSSSSSGLTNHPPFLLLSSTTTTDEEQLLTEKEEELLFGGGGAGIDDNSARNSDSQFRKKDKFGNVLPSSLDRRRPNINNNNNNPRDHAADPLINKLHTIRNSIQSCPELWLELAQACPELRAVVDEHLCDTKIDLTFAQFADSVRRSAALFRALGVQRGTHVAVLGENSARWLQIDQGIQFSGGTTAVRGADAPLEELRYIYRHSDSAGIAVLQGPKLLNKFIQDVDTTASDAAPLGLCNEKYGAVRTVILMHREKATDAQIDQWATELGIQIRVFADLLAATPPMPVDSVSLPTKSDLATIVYTSGTTGQPKGVMLTQGNLLHQTGHRLGPSLPYEESEPLPGEKMLSLLPVWHITERTFELWMAVRGCSVVYSTIRTFKKDLAKHKPEWLVLVPRVLEKVASGVQDKFASGSAAVRVLSKFFTNVGKAHFKHKKIVRGLVVGEEAPGILEVAASKAALVFLKPLHAIGNKLVWSKVQEGFGGKLKVIISGGSALAGALESFYETAGFTVSVGYGLTECSPLISFRRTDANLVTGGCVGKACFDTELRVVDPNPQQTSDDETNPQPRKALPNGEAGLVIAKGPQVMKGYYKNKEATAKAIDQFGWFDTGDLGRINPATGDLILTGRAKDTIVLSNGENVEPVPIEDAIVGEALLIDQVMLTGQDGRSLIAITVLNPSGLADCGLMDRKLADRLQEAIDTVNDPKCTAEDCEAKSKILREASNKLRSNPDVKKAISDIFRSATANFRVWERVSDAYLTLEPFAMSNGQLTQSYKVKRAQVMERYGEELPK